MVVNAEIRTMLQDLAAEEIRYQPTFAFIGHWLSALDVTEGLKLPGFDPSDIPTLLPYVYLLELVGRRMRYRVSGEEVNRLFGSSHGGKFLDQVVPPEIYSEVSRYFLDVFDEKACVFKGHVLLPNKEFLEFERVLLPVARQETVQLLGALALSVGSAPRAIDPLPAPPEPGFHFTQIDLRTGTIERGHKMLFPLVSPSR